ncbi:MAG: alpha/beta fold hydrolase [Gammaproteobacteria bacterium]|nr:alpha/beta fold hydrolase [Gammaproteobacteria bacterium]MBU1645029.1 alpha/beta fold hydrolase [Gammaproteobacteria bacterium]MBU1973266.1 alpha/beta fold hydrolase [Gammaproteobacteria bacterium]
MPVTKPQARLMALLALLAAASPATAGTLAPGDHRFELGSGSRSYLVHVPPQAAAGPLPVVLSLHGGGGNARQHRQDSGMDAAADRDGYIAVYPNGSGRLRQRLLTWNAGNCCGHSQTQDIDDVGFIAALLDDLERRAAIDPRRIYVAGHSNGGMMAHRLGEAMPGRIAAIVSVAGAHVPAAVATGRAMPMMHVHSLDDPRAIYGGGLGPPFPLTGSRVLHPAVDATVAAWVRRNGCAATPVEREFHQDAGQTARRLVHAGCRDGAEVALWQLTGVGHGWPGASTRRDALVGPATQLIDANTEIWRFVSRFSLPQPAATSAPAGR